MLPRSKRISIHLFGNIIQKGEVFHSTYFVLRRLKSDKNSQFAISVPKKVAKTAVARNKIKRRIYSIIQKVVPVVVLNQKVVIVAKGDVAKLSFAETRDEICKIFVKCGLLK